MKTLILSFAAMLLCFVCSAGVLYISHRGESADAPENTMAASGAVKVSPGWSTQEKWKGWMPRVIRVSWNWVYSALT